ncbi:hypothetical protein B7Z00_04890 [Candidatus Saccharibacteria bacterium 32-50-10]|nr:MAG: hypothetical protein B7Z00_04890 [Candidatus Saccharibacteria bacterium 32-50-10]
MNSSVYDDVALERVVQDRFGLAVDVSSVILRQVDVSRSAKATVFLTKKKQLLLYIEASSPLLLADVKKIVSRMGLKAEFYMPPKGQPHYFDDIGRAKFLSVFPGRTTVTDEDIIFYKTLAPYNPALVMIGEVKNGEIYQFDADSRDGWRMAAKFAYRRIRTS